MLNKKSSSKKFSSLLDFDSYLGFLFEYKWVLFFFVIFLFFQLFQLTFVHWDKSVYIENGKWFCGKGTYFEFIRPPLPGVLNCFFGGADYSIFFTTILACFLYLAALLLLFSKQKNGLNQIIFAAFAFLFPAILFNSNFGSDLLALSFLLLAFGIDSPIKKGFVFALSSVSRYNFLVFGLVLLWEQRRAPKKILFFLVPVFLVWLPWMIYNYLFTGNPFFSVYETIYLNVLQKGLSSPISLDQLAVIVLFVLSVFLSGVKNNFFDQKNKSAFFLVLMFLVSGIKEMRFINLLSPVIAFNAALASNKNKKFFLFFALIFLGFLFSFWYSWYNFGVPAFTSVFSYPTDSFMYSCRVASDKWVFFYDEGIVAECVYDINSIKSFINRGGIVVLYNYSAFDLKDFNIINRGDYVIIKSNTCVPQPKTYISGSLRQNIFDWLSKTNSNIYDYSDWAN